MRKLLARPRAVAGLPLDRIDEDTRLYELESRKYHLRLVEPEGSSRLQTQQFIARAYRRIFQATLKDFYPSIIALCGEREQMLGAAGARYADGQQLFAEQYLSVPAEVAIRYASGERVSRQNLVEVGSFSVIRPALTYPFISMIGGWLLTYEVEWLVLVLTRTLRRLFERARINVFDLGPAARDRLSPSVNDWGAYYQHDPRVMAISLHGGLARFQAHHCAPPAPAIRPTLSNDLVCPA